MIGSFSFNREQLNRLFPFYVLLNHDLTIISCGDSVNKLFGNCNNTSFEALFDCRLTAAEPVSFEALLANQNKEFIIETRVYPQIRLRGEFQATTMQGFLLFLGVPWSAPFSEVNTPSLAASNFALHDPLIDLLNVAGTQAITSNDIKALFKRLDKQKQALEKLSAIAEASNDGMLIFDAEGKIEWVNKGFERRSGYTLAEVIGTRPLEYLAGTDTNSGTIHYMEEQVRNALPMKCEVLYYTASGKPYWVRVNGRPLLDRTGNASQYFVLEEDITNQKNAESKPVQSENQVRLALEKIGDNLWEHDFSTGITTFSKHSLFLLGIGFTGTESKSSFWWNAVHKNDLHLLNDNDKAYRAGLIDHHSLEYRMVMTDGSIRWILDRGVAINKNSDGMPLKIIGTHTDITSIKNTEEALRKSQQRWRFALEGSGACVWEYDFENDEGSYSSQYAQMLGYDEHEHDEHYNWLKHVHPDDKHILRHNDFLYLYNLQTQHSITYRLRCKNGSYKWILDRGMLLEKSEDERPLYSIGTHTDITAIKNTQQELEATANRLSTLISNLNSGVLVEDETRHVILANQVFCDLFDIALKPNAMVGSDYTAAANDSKRLFRNSEAFTARISELLERKESVFSEELELADGRFFERDFIPIYRQKKYLGQLWLYTDITERKLADNAIRRSEEKYRMLIANMNLGLLEVDVNDQIVYTNQSFCKMSGFEYDELIGKSASETFLIDKNPDLMREKNDSRKKGISDAYEIGWRTKTGELRWWLISGAPILSDSGDFVGSIGIHLDITEQKKLEMELRVAKRGAEQSASAKEIFLANMSHEIRTPMNAIIGMSRQLKKTALNEKQAAYLDAIKNASDSLLIIINDILDFSKIESGKLTLENIGFELPKIIKHCTGVVNYKAEEKGLVFGSYISPTIANVLIGDPFRLQQVLLNLLSNSVKFTEKGSVNILCKLVKNEADTQQIKISVSDTGIGMSEDFLANLFNKFTQEDETVSRRFGGTGLGMSISKQLVELMNGTIYVDSKKGFGTSVHITLPFTIGSSIDLPVEKQREADKSVLLGSRILLAEDNLMNQIVANTLLEQYGAVVDNAANGKIAVELLQKGSYDIVLMDVRMPEMDGIEATRRIRASVNKTIPIIALTANALKIEQDKCRAAGMDDFVAKPFEEEELITCIAKWLGQEINFTHGTTEKTIAYHRPLYKLDTIQAISRGNNAFVKRILEIFIAESRSAVQQMHEALTAGNYEKIRSVAHRIKPSLGNMAIDSLKHEIDQLEKLEETELGLNQLPGLVERLGDVLAAVNKQLEAEIENLI